ncbi:heat-inducible transcriptional repressor HrcA [Pseudostreptobacillus hongkongensis]|uniref:heat-inducible transcriptional repressor HrcA n=1 Tax=Pseudostreptobacillus hongkongensis TaxID=1162717 RepID=UPI0028D255FD|nr:heat-inducible transcriptional repressor HrcA [Pseudostreptobacillus hongkongensis]
MNDREKEVFKIIISHYLNSGESVGSRTLEKKYNMGVSSATIRNVMADLEEMGLITKTHTSSGRVPTLEGYRMYIDNLLQETDIPDEIKDKIFLTYQKRINKTDIIFKETAKLLAEVSGCMSIVLEPSSEVESIKKIQFIKITERDVYVVVVLNNNIIKTSVLSMSTYITEENVENLNIYMKNLIETTHKDFSLSDLEQFLSKIGKTDLEVEDKKIFEKNKIFIDGVDNLITHENMDIESFVKTIKFVSNEVEIKNIFRRLAKESEYDVEKANIVFGKDLEIEDLKDYVFIFKCYEFGDDKGVLGLLSSTRIDYGKIVATIDFVITMLKKSLNQNAGNKFLELKL